MAQRGIGYCFEGRCSFEKKCRRHIEGSGNLLKPAGADSIGPFFVFLDLLERQPQGVAQFFLTHAKHHAPHTDAAADMPVNRVRYFFHEIRSNSHGSAASFESRDAGTSIWRRILISQMRPAAYRRAAFFPRSWEAGFMMILRHWSQTILRERPPPATLPMKTSAGAQSGMQEDRNLHLFGEDSFPVAAHFAQAVQRPPIEGSRDRDDVLRSNLLGQAEWQHPEMKLDETQQQNGVDLDDRGRDPAFQAPFDHAGQKRVCNWSRKTAPFPMARRDAMTGAFPDMRSNWPLDFAQLRHNFRQKVRTCRREHTLIT